MSLETGNANGAPHEKPIFQKNAPEAALVAQSQKSLQRNLVYSHMCVNLSLSLICQSSRTQLLSELLKGNAAKCTALLSMWQSSVGALEFLLSPTIGRLSDSLGRR